MTPEEEFTARFMKYMGGQIVSQVIECQACKQKNRIQPTNDDPRCGKCGLPLK